jgi:hypothetical protein
MADMVIELKNESKKNTDTIMAEFHGLQQRLSSVEESVEAFRSNVDSIRENVTEHTNDIGLLKGELLAITEKVSSVEPNANVALETLFNCEREIYGNSIVIRGLEVQEGGDVGKAVKDFLVDIGIDTCPIETFHMGKPSSVGNRVIGVTCALKKEAMAILQKKKSLKENPKYKKVFVDAKHSFTYLSCDRKMRQFARIHGKDVELKPHKDGLLAVKENVVLKRGQFSSDSIKVGPITFRLVEAYPVTATAPMTQSNSTKNKVVSRTGSMKRNNTGESLASQTSRQTRSTRLRHDDDVMDVSSVPTTSTAADNDEVDNQLTTTICEL